MHVLTWCTYFIAITSTVSLGDALEIEWQTRRPHAWKNQLQLAADGSNIAQKLSALLLAYKAVTLRAPFASSNHEKLSTIAPRVAQSYVSRTRIQPVDMQLGLSRPSKHKGFKRAVTLVGSLPGIPSLLKSLLVFLPSPAIAATTLKDYVAVWSNLIPGITVNFRFFGFVGIMELLSVLAINGILTFNGKRLEKIGNVMLAGASFSALFTHVKLGQPFYHAALLAALYLCNAFILKDQAER